jgi:hypothetical protein
MKKITLCQPNYPYGKKQIYLGGSIITVGAQLDAMGYTVEFYDENLGHRHPQLSDKDQYFGISVLGAPYIPSAINDAKEIYAYTGNRVLVGGQGIESLKPEHFNALFGNTAIQIRNEGDLLAELQEDRAKMPDALSVSLAGILSKMHPDKLKLYMQHEMTMVLSQGCHFKCAFCAAKKARVEKFKSIECFEADMRFLALSAQKFGIKELQFYATSLDFFQNPKMIFKYLEILVCVQKEYEIRFQVRCLSCLTSFMNAVVIRGRESFKKLMGESGLWCVGFGVDGADPKVWKAQKKNQNHLSDIKDCLDLAQEMGVRSEILLVMGFPQDTFRTLLKCLTDSIRYVRHWPNTMLRPYLAKEFVPGNDNWASGTAVVESFISDPKKFYNLDFCTIGSKITHPRFWHRIWSNMSYLLIIVILTPFGKCVTSPLLPQGNNGLYGKIAKKFNEIVPFDR